MAVALPARFQPDRAVLVEVQELPARGQGAHAPGTGESINRRAWPRDEGRHPRLVQALRLLISARVKDAIVDLNGDMTYRCLAAVIV